MRDVGLKPRKTGDLPPEKLAQVLSTIYPEETVMELMGKLFDKDGERKNDESCND